MSESGEQMNALYRWLGYLWLPTLLPLLALLGCSDDVEAGLDAPPIVTSIVGTYTIEVTTPDRPADPCICGDWCEADEWELLTVSKDGDLYTADFRSDPAIYSATLVGSEVEPWRLALPALVWDDRHRTGELHLVFSDRGAVEADFVYFNDGLTVSFQKRLDGVRR